MANYNSQGERLVRYLMSVNVRDRDYSNLNEARQLAESALEEKLSDTEWKDLCELEGLR